MQPVELDDRGVARFRRNAIVCHLLDKGGFTMNDLARLPFSDEDRMQFAQLIGYSVSGYCDLSYVSDESCDTALAESDACVGLSGIMRDIVKPWQTFEFAFELEFKDGCLRMFPANQSSLQWLRQHEEQVTRIWNSVKKPLIVRTDSPKDLLAVRDKLLTKLHESFQDMHFSGSVLMPVREVVESWRRYE